ncbi:MAG: M48 family metalloprotease [Panacagrimonas sp.]
MKPQTASMVAAVVGLSLASGAALAEFDLGGMLEKAGSILEKTTEVITRTDEVVTPKSEDEELAIGQQWAAMLTGAAPLMADEKAQRYVNRVGRWVALQSERPQLNWRFGVLDSDNLNAFATPGGFVFITKGLLLRLNNEAELAGVLGHEIAHVVQKHHLAAIQKGGGIGIGAELISKFGLSKTDYAEASNKLLSGAKEVMLRGLDKSDEYEADRMGVVLAARAGYDPFGLPSVLQTIESIATNDSSVALLFQTHPAPTARLDALDEAMGEPLEALADQPQLPERFQAQLGER